MAFSTKTEVSAEKTCTMKGKFESMHNIQITEEGVTKLLNKLNPHKALGPDKITSGVLKELATHISGFRKGLSCDTHLVEFVDDVIRNLDSGKQTDCLIMNFSKVFDKVCHNLLIHKLHHYGIRGKTNRWIQSFIRDRNQSVVVEGETSNSIPVPQGSVLGPSLFLFYISDMPENIRSKTRLLADDTIVYLTITSDIDSVTLQNDLNKLAKWEKRWKMSFHPETCNVLTIRRKKQPIMNSYTLHGHQL